MRRIRRSYLEVLQRELANIIMNEDLETFERAFYWIRDWESEVSRSDSKRWLAEHDLLLKIFPNLEDFDLVSTKHFVQYDDQPMWAIDDAIDRYKEISKFLVLDRFQDQVASRDLQYGEQETEIFRKRIQQYKDKRRRDD